MQYEGNIIRPPSEASSIVLQVTAGCSHNKCSFCGAYKDKQFRIRHDSIDADIDFASKYCRRQRRVFLADGDVLIIPQRKLVTIFEKIRQKLPWVNRISLYANGKAVRSKSIPELLQLKTLGLDKIYMGLESGHDEVLKKINKGETSQSMIEAAEKVNTSGLCLSVTVLLGIAGVELSQAHAEATGKVLSSLSPNQIAALTVIPLPNTKLFNDIEAGLFVLPDSNIILKELKTVIQFITLNRVQFFANHASNYLHLSGRLQKDKNAFIDIIDKALCGSVPLIHDEWRRL